MNKRNKEIDIEIEKEVSQFLDGISFIINAMYLKNQNDWVIADIKRYLGIARREIPIMVFEAVGPYLWRYRAQIIENNIDSLLNDDFYDILNDSLTGSPKTLNDAIKTRDNFKKTWIDFSIKEKNELNKIGKRILSNYANYIKLTKNN